MKKTVITAVSLFFLTSNGLSVPQVPIVILDKPFHAGDGVFKQMDHLRPNGRKFSGTFKIEDIETFPLKLNLTITLSHIISPPKSKADRKGRGKKMRQAYKRGSYRTKILLNGVALATLNEKLSSADRSKARSGKPVTITIKVNSGDLKKGTNTLEITPGGNGKNAGDIELYKIVMAL